MSARILLAMGALTVLASCVSAPPTPELRIIEDSSSEMTPIVETCIDAKGEILDVHIVRSSNYPELDEAALKVARTTRYSAGMYAGKPLERSCVKFKVKFVIKDGEAVPAGDTAAVPSKPAG